MRTQTNLVPRGNRYQFRKKVPKELFGRVGPRSGVIRESLGEGLTLTQAKAEAARRAAHWESEFEKAGKALAPRPVVPLTPELVPVLVQALQTSILTADEEIRGEGLGEEQFAQLESVVQGDLTQVRRAYARGDDSPVRHQLADWLQGLGIDADPDSPQARTLRREFLKARLRALEGSDARNRGEIVETPSGPSAADIAGSLSDSAAQPLATKARSGGPRLADVVAYWKSTGEKVPRTVAAADSLVREFTELHGDIPLADITKAHFVALRDKLLARVKPATVQARFNLLRAAFTTCLKDDKHGLAANPLEYVKVRKVDSGEKPRGSFTAEQLQALFDSNVFTKGDRPKGGGGDAARWAPLAALFRGARLDELLSLRTDGVYQHEGVWVFHEHSRS